MEPAASIIRKLGGEKFAATVLGTAYTAPSRWQHPRQKGGTGGLIPQRHHLALLAHARQRQVRLSAEDFLPREVRAGVTGSPQ
jgi:hypothetical protein